MSGLSALSAIDGYVVIESNDALNNLSGFENLTSVGSYLRIKENSSLGSLAGFESLVTIGDSLIISDNSSLVTLMGIENIDPATISHLTIKNNSELSVCNIPNICEYLINGEEAVISNNALSCFTPPIVITECLSSTDETQMEEGIIVFPNPAGKSVKITNRSGENIGHVVIYNQLGQAVMQTQSQNQVNDISRLSNGLYILEAHSGDRKYFEKLVVE